MASLQTAVGKAGQAIDVGNAVLCLNPATALLAGVRNIGVKATISWVGGITSRVFGKGKKVGIPEDSNDHGNDKKITFEKGDKVKIILKQAEIVGIKLSNIYIGRLLFVMSPFRLTKISGLAATKKHSEKEIICR